MKNNKLVYYGVIGVLTLIIALFFNPFGYNDPTERTVVTQQSGAQFVKFGGGIFYEGFFAKASKWPNQISVSYVDSIPNLEMHDNTVEIGHVSIRFNDATTADASGIVQYVLPETEAEMLEIHNAHRTPEALVKRRLAPYTQECLQSSAQLLSSEMHYSGGRAQMVQDYLDQLKEGAFLLKLKTFNVFDSIEKANKKTYEVIVRTDKDGHSLRKFSSIKKYAITVGDAQVTLVDYEKRVDDMLAKKVEASANASVSKTKLMTAQQEALTAEALGKKKLVETEYAQKVAQTTQTVQAQTKVDLATLARKEAEENAKVAVFNAQITRTDADAEAYKNRQLVSAGLSPLDKATIEKDTKIGVAEAIAKTAWPTTYINGGGSGNGGGTMDQIISLLLLQQTKK